MGVFPNNPTRELDYFSVTGLSKDSDIAVVAVKRYADRNVILITSGVNYVTLNKTQCEVTFMPAMFNVHVDVVKKLISVKFSSNETEHAPLFFDSAAGIAVIPMNQINVFGMISTTLYVSVFGEAFLFNIKAFTSDDYPPLSNSKIYSAIADSFHSMLNGIFVFMGSSQFFVSHDFTTVDTRLTVRAVRIEDPKYVFASFCICDVLLAALAVEACRTQLWRRLPRWDFVDTKDLVLASAVAGHDMVSEMYQKAKSGEMQWTSGKIDSWSSKWVKKNTPSFDLRLGKKVVNSTQDWKEGDELRHNDATENREIRLIALSLWMRSAEGVAPLE